MYICPETGEVKISLQKSVQLYRDAYSGHPRKIWALAILTLINRMGTMVLPFLSVYLTTKLNFSLFQAGLITSVFGVGTFFGAFFGGKLSDRIGPNPVIIVSLFMGGIFFIMLQWAKDLPALYTLFFLVGMFGEAYRPAMSAAVGQYALPGESGRSMALIRLAIGLGMSLGPMIGGFVAAAWGYEWLFRLDGTTCVVAAIFFFINVRSWQRKASDQAAELPMDGKPTLAPWRNPDYLLFLLATFFMGFAFMQWFHAMPIFIKQEWLFDERYIGILMGVSSMLIALFEMPIVHSMEKRKKVSFAILTGLVFFTVCYIPFLFPRGLYLCFIAMLLWTLGVIFFLPFNNIIPLNMSGADKRGEYMSWYWMCWSLTGILGPGTGLGFAETHGFSALWLGLAGMMGISLLMNVLLRERIGG